MWCIRSLESRRRRSYRHFLDIIGAQFTTEKKEEGGQLLVTSRAGSQSFQEIYISKRAGIYTNRDTNGRSWTSVTSLWIATWSIQQYLKSAKVASGIVYKRACIGPKKRAVTTRKIEHRRFLLSAASTTKIGRPEHILANSSHKMLCLRN